MGLIVGAVHCSQLGLSEFLGAHPLRMSQTLFFFFVLSVAAELDILTKADLTKLPMDDWQSINTLEIAHLVLGVFSNKRCFQSWKLLNYQGIFLCKVSYPKFIAI